MLFTSVTSAVGFASLALTPIPPVQIFGLHVAFGILIAFILTIALVPAYIVSLSPQRLQALKDHSLADGSSKLLGRLLATTGRFAVNRAKAIVLLFVIATGISVYGVSTIQINDNPVRWFKEDHRLRVADKVMNSHFPGTYDAFLVLDKGPQPDALEQLWAGLLATALPQSALDKLRQLKLRTANLPYAQLLQILSTQLDDLAYEDSQNEPVWLALLDQVEAAQNQAKFFLTPKGLTYLEGCRTFWISLIK